jgi:endonuclease/exonuclease/phosphatase family metal-dependent hydrolase
MHKFVFLNAWGHRNFEEMGQFLYSLRADIICLTEVTDVTGSPYTSLHTSDDEREPACRLDGLALVRSVLPGHQIRYATAMRRTWRCVRTGRMVDNVGFGSALCFKSTLPVIAIGDEILQCPLQPTPGPVLQWLVYENQGVRHLVAHMHGMWFKENTKGDDPRRDWQSLAIRAHLSRLKIEHDVKRTILGGDFNLCRDTRALRALEEGTEGDEPFRNLIREHNIQSTRTQHYRHAGMPGYSLDADYVLVSQEVEVTGFVVHTLCLASDHAPLLLMTT